jgi:hypothetical protein
MMENIQRAAPSGLLLVMDLPHVQNRPLYGLAATQSLVLDNAEVAMILAVLSSVGAAQKHRKQQNARLPSQRKEGRSSLSGFPRTRVVAKGVGDRGLAKNARYCESQASALWACATETPGRTRATT